MNLVPPTQDTLLLETALAYGRKGRPVFPVKPNKQPLTKHGFKEASTDEEQIHAWWTRWPRAGIAVPTGPDWFVLDVDDEHALAALTADHGPLPPTVEAVTPRPGRHFYLHGRVTNSRGALPDGIDVRGLGGYVLIPPSPHENGCYEWRTTLDEVPIAPAPKWLLGLLTARKHQNGHAPVSEGEIPRLQRNVVLASMAGTMRRRGFHEPAIAAALLVVNRDRCNPPLAEEEVRTIARSVGRYEPAEDAEASLDELNALLGLDDVGKRIDRVSVFGRSTKGAAYLHLDDGEKITLDPIGSFTTVGRLSAELALRTGAQPMLKTPAVVRFLALLYLLGEHSALHELDDLARERGVEYLGTIAVGEFVPGDQASRWEAFNKLDSVREASRFVLKDSGTGHRYVRVNWFADWLRMRSSPGEPDRVMTALTRLGWQKPGTEGRIKASQPRFKRTLQWAFFVVSPGWEDE